MQNKKIFLLGKDSSGWSIDSDRRNVKRAMLELGFQLTSNPFEADIFYVVWWNKMFKWSYRILNLLFGKRIWIVTATNELDYQRKQVLIVDNKVDFWVVANQQQKRLLLEIGRKEERIITNPFYIDGRRIKYLNLSKQELCDRLNLKFGDIENKFLIGSFQKDSLGSDLSKPKWQKGTELLRDVLVEIKESEVLLVLAGPRRHFIVKQCRELGIPFLFLGESSFIDKNMDDCLENNLPIEKINLLYNLVDLYLVTSKSEGGPKAVLEAPLTKTAILSTKVGMAPDLLSEEMLCENKDEFVVKIKRFIAERKLLTESASDAYNRISKVNNHKSFVERVKLTILKAGNEN